MTQKTLNSKLRFIRKGERITADWLNSVVARADRVPTPLEPQDSEVPEGENSGAAPADVIYTETGRTTSTVRIEDASDPAIYVDIERIETVNFLGDDGSTLRLDFVNT